jgi:hypothetical protein
VAAQGQPLIKFAMVDEQNPAFVDDKNGHGKINFFVNMGH